MIIMYVCEGAKYYFTYVNKKIIPTMMLKRVLYKQTHTRTQILHQNLAHRLFISDKIDHFVTGLTYPQSASAFERKREKNLKQNIFESDFKGITRILCADLLRTKGVTSHAYHNKNVFRTVHCTRRVLRKQPQKHNHRKLADYGVLAKATERRCVAPCHRIG